MWNGPVSDCQLCGACCVQQGPFDGSSYVYLDRREAKQLRRMGLTVVQDVLGDSYLGCRSHVGAAGRPVWRSRAKSVFAVAAPFTPSAPLSVASSRLARCSAAPPVSKRGCPSDATVFILRQSSAGSSTSLVDHSATPDSALQARVPWDHQWYCHLS